MTLFLSTISSTQSSSIGFIHINLPLLFALNSVRHSDDYSFIPSISILVAILAAIANIILLIIFIHQIAISIQADKVVADISGFIFRFYYEYNGDLTGQGWPPEKSIS